MSSSIQPAPSSGRNIPVAIAAGVTLGSIVGISVWLGPIAIIVMLAAITGVGMFEISRAFNQHSGFLNLKIDNPTTYIAMGFMPFMYYAAYYSGTIGLVLFMAIAFIAGFFFLVLKKTPGRALDQMAGFALLLLWLPFLISFVPLIMRLAHGVQLGIVVTLFTIANDIGAFLVGRKYGSHKLIPSVSPNKTWEGLAGGVGFSVVLALILRIWLMGFMPIWHVILLASASAVASVVGDLLESLVKRDLGLKDFGTIMPGHGGIMDRIDSHIIAFPTAWIVLLLLGYGL